jgi:hypothetical protein
MRAAEEELRDALAETLERAATIEAEVLAVQRTPTDPRRGYATNDAVAKRKRMEEIGARRIVVARRLLIAEKLHQTRIRRGWKSTLPIQVQMALNAFERMEQIGHGWLAFYAEAVIQAVVDTEGALVHDVVKKADA